LCLTDVTHAYFSDTDDRFFVLGPIDLEIVRGETVFVIGGNGSGKSTMVKLLTGLYVPERGHIRCGKRVIDDDSRRAYRELFATVFSDFHLFADLPVGPGNEQRIAYFLEKLSLHHKVKVVAGKLSTLMLSQGQRKRLALLSAYLEDRPIY